MRNEQKYKRSREYDAEYRSDDLVKEFEGIARKKKKHKSHKYKSDDDSYEKDKLVHGYGSEEEANYRNDKRDDRVHHRDIDNGDRNSRETKYNFDKKRDRDKHKDRERRQKHRSQSESSDDYDLERKKKHCSRKYKNISDSGSEPSETRSSEHHGKHKNSENKHLKRYDRKSKEEYDGRDRSQNKVKKETNVKSEPLDNSDNRRNEQIRSREHQTGREHSPHGRRNGQQRQGKNRNIKDEYEWGGNKSKDKRSGAVKAEVEKPNFGLSGKLADDTNVFNGVVVKYSEPPEARMPKKRWRLYQFKGDQDLPTLYIHRQSAYLLGRDRKVADIPIDHPSCSKQHAALQYRLVPYNRADGSVGKQIRLYIIDLESANGTYINNNRIETRKYVELFEKDVIKFGFSSREYVLLHEHSKDDELKSEEEP